MVQDIWHLEGLHRLYKAATEGNYFIAQEPGNPLSKEEFTINVSANIKNAYDQNYQSTFLNILDLFELTSCDKFEQYNNYIGQYEGNVLAGNKKWKVHIKTPFVSRVDEQESVDAEQTFRPGHIHIEEYNTFPILFINIHYNNNTAYADKREGYKTENDINLLTYTRLLQLPYEIGKEDTWQDPDKIQLSEKIQEHIKTKGSEDIYIKRNSFNESFTIDEKNLKHDEERGPLGGVRNRTPQVVPNTFLPLLEALHKQVRKDEEMLIDTLQALVRT